MIKLFKGKPREPAEDELLVAGCKAGDLQSQSSFVERFKGPIFRRMMRMTGSRDLAEDLTQDALIRGLTRIDRYRENVSLDGWMHRIAVNLMRDHFRAERVRGEHLSQNEPVMVAALPAPGRSTDDLLVDLEQRRALNSAVGALPNRYRDVVVLAYYDDRSVEDIARVLGLGLSAVKMRLKRAREMLHRKLENQG